MKWDDTATDVFIEFSRIFRDNLAGIAEGIAHSHSAKTVGAIDVEKAQEVMWTNAKPECPTACEHPMVKLQYNKGDTICLFAKDVLSNECYDRMRESVAKCLGIPLKAILIIEGDIKLGVLGREHASEGSE